MSGNKLAYRVFLAWLVTDMVFLGIGLRWQWLFHLGTFGLPLDLLLGIFVLGRYLHDNGRL